VTRYRVAQAGRWWAAALLLSLSVAITATWMAFRPHRLDSIADRIASEPVAEPDGEMERRIRAFCGDCHALPRPASFPRDVWHAEVRKGYDFYSRSGRTDLDVPPLSQVVAWYRSQAPKQLDFPVTPDAEHPLRVAFRRDPLGQEKATRVVPAISYLKWIALQEHSAGRLVSCDMRSGAIAAIDPADTDREQQLLGTLEFPCHLEPCDVDSDGLTDLVVADLGSFSPADHDRGRVVLMRQAPDGTFRQTVLASGLGRVADVRPVDVDRDSDMDLIVAVFGVHDTGRTVLLRNVTESDEGFDFEQVDLDRRPGTSHLPLHDLTGNGLVDFIALVSQEYEQIVMFLNQHDSVEPGPLFRSRILWEAPDLTYGLNGIELADLDSDGDKDVVFSNGDAFDNFMLNPSHGVQWLENDGSLQFTYHRIADMVGACSPKVGDIDGDGDQDIICVSWIPSTAKPRAIATGNQPAILCLEQIAPNRFARHTLDSGFPHLPALEMADFDNDGDLDFAVGSYLLDAGDRTPYSVAVWWNE